MKGPDRIPAMFLVIMMIITLVPLVPTGSGIEEVRATGTKYYLQERFFIPAGWDRDRMYVHVFLQNYDRDPSPDVTGEGEFAVGQVANSYQAAMDGSSHSSGDVRRTLFELITDTDCTYCPGADGAAHRLIESERFPDEMTVIEWHYNTVGEADPYETKSAKGRASFYGVTGTPTAIVDGELILPGGSSSWNDKAVDRAYESMLDLVDEYPPLASFEVKGWFIQNGTDYDGYMNVSVEIIGALPKGNWTLVASICEDTYDPQEIGVFHRFTQRYTKGELLTGLNQGRPGVTIDDLSTLGPDEDEPVRDNVTIYWTASDPQDGTDLMVNIGYQRAFGGPGIIATGLMNTGEYRWNTMSPRVPDGVYFLIVTATDSSGNEVADYSRSFILDNLDRPELEITSPRTGSSISGRYEVRWNSSDDEDERIDLLVRISLSEDLGVNWEPLSYNHITGLDWEVDDGTYDFNTAFYIDKATYKLRIELLDTSGMSVVREVGPFEIYNNDPPELTILSPTPAKVQTGSVLFSYELFDQEDGADGLHLLVRTIRLGSGPWIIVHNGTPSGMEGNFSVETDELSGDGEYELEMIVTDSRGRSFKATTTFNVYDPDGPFFQNVSYPTEPVAGSASIRWNASDPDAGETLRFSIYIRPTEEGNWTELASDLTRNSYEFDVSAFPDGRYMMMLVAMDSSSYRLEASTELGPITVDNPQAPAVVLIEPVPGFKGTIDNRSLDGLLLKVRWNGSDQDGGPLKYSLHYRVERSTAWLPIITDLAALEYAWNISSLPDGKYYLRVIVEDHTGLEGESSTDLFTLRKPEPPKPPIEDPEKDNKRSNATSDIDLSSLALFGGISLVVVIVIAAVAVSVLSFSRRKKKETAVVPTEEEIDLEVPDFDRRTAGIYSGQMPGAPPAPSSETQAQEAAEVPVTHEEVPDDEDTGGQE